MKRFTIPFIIAAMSTVASSQQFGGAVRFYFSTPGGDNSRILQDTVTSSAWTAEYDIVFENVSGHDITFNGAFVMIGFGRTTEFGEFGSPIPGTDTIRERFAFSGNPTFADNPNITWQAPWSMTASARTRMYGGFSQPLSGPIRPWGLYAHTPTAGGPMVIRSGESMVFFRLAIRDNGLFANQGINSIQLYNYPLQAGASTSLWLSGTNNVYYYDNQNYFENSKLILVAPEPSSFCLAGVAIGLLVMRRKRSTNA